MRSSSAVTLTSQTAGRRMTRRTARPQKRSSMRASASGSRPNQGMRSALTRSPSRLSIAGNSVSAATTEATPTRIAPTARLRRIESGTKSMPVIATTNATPLASIRRGWRWRRRRRSPRPCRPVTALLAEAGDDEERVVDAQRQAHAADHVHDEERQLVGLARRAPSAPARRGSRRSRAAPARGRRRPRRRRARAR